MALPGPDASLVGKLLDERYEVLEVIGQGGVGVVYRARHVNLERMVAVKVLHESLIEDAGFVKRFQREAVAMSRLYHPHCVSVIDSGVYGSRPYLVLEYLPGDTITKLLGKGPFDPLRAVHIALQLLETLEYFHSNHVIHRDLKSENVMLVESSGTADFVKVLDFGMAKILTGPGADSQLSKIGLVPGTPSAMAPEQIHQLPPDPRIDIYATGILLYEMIVGRRPFTGPDGATVVKMQLSAPPKPPRQVLGESALSAELEAVIIKALEKDRIDRFATASEMAAAIRLTPEGRVTSLPPLPDSRQPAPTAARSRVRRRRTIVALGTAIVLGSLAVAMMGRKDSGSHAAAKASATDPRRSSATPAAATALAPAPALPPAVASVAPVAPVETWLTHRDRAADFAARGELDSAFREVTEALVADPVAAATDPTLGKTAVGALNRERVAFAVGAFRANPAFVAELGQVTSAGATSDLRHAAYEGLRVLGQEGEADTIAMAMLDVEQAGNCAAMRDAWQPLRTAKGARIKAFKAELRARGRKDLHVRCLKRWLRR